MLIRNSFKVQGLVWDSVCNNSDTMPEIFSETYKANLGWSKWGKTCCRSHWNDELVCLMAEVLEEK